MYVVPGATGHTGSAVAKNLLKKAGARRHPQTWKKARSLKTQALAVADLQNADESTGALKSGTVLYLMNSPNY